MSTTLGCTATALPCYMYVYVHHFVYAVELPNEGQIGTWTPVHYSVVVLYESKSLFFAMQKNA